VASSISVDESQSADDYDYETMMMMMGVQCQRVLNIFSRVFGALVAISQRTDRHAASIKKNCFRYQVSPKCRPEKVQGEAF